jgi:predicted permease
LKELLISFEIVVPIFLLIALGYFLKRIKLMSDDITTALNKLVFNVFFPVMIFNSLYKSSFTQAFNAQVIIYTVAYLAIVFLLAMLIVPRVEKQDTKRSVLMQGWYRAFTLLFGYPILMDLYGESGIALLAIVVAIAVPIRNVMGVVTLELYGQDKSNAKKMLKNIALNPLIISSILGLIAMTIDFKMPQVIAKPLSDVAKIGAPIALISLGAFFKFSRLRKNIKQIIIGVGGRLIVLPIIFMAAAIMLGFRGVELVVILAVVCVPTGTATFVMSQQMGGDGELASQLIVIGTLVSAVTIFVWIFVLKQLALI